MRFNLVKITPEVAREYLKRNTNNRRPRSAKIGEYAEMMKRGDWRVNHQGVAFDSDGKLQDGQNRLMAIIQADVPVDMLVVTGCEPENFDSIDRGLVRNIADVLRIDSMSAEVVGCLGRILIGHGKAPVAVLHAIHEAYGEVLLKLREAVSFRRKGVTSAPVRSAVALLSVEGQNILDDFAVFAGRDYNIYTPKMLAFVRWLDDKRGKLGSNEAQNETAVRALHCFSQEDNRNKLYSLERELLMLQGRVKRSLREGAAK